jgi:hypothetical protein
MFLYHETLLARNVAFEILMCDLARRIFVVVFPDMNHFPAGYLDLARVAPRGTVERSESESGSGEWFSSCGVVQ